MEFHDASGQVHDVDDWRALKAEEELLGALLADNSSYAHVAGGILTVHHFGDSLHALIYEIISGHLDAGEPVDEMRVGAELSGVQVYNPPDGHKTITELLTALVPGQDVARCALIIYGGCVRRQMRDFQHEFEELRGEIEELRAEIAALKSRGGHLRAVLQ